MQKLHASGAIDCLHDDWRTVDLPNQIENGILLPDSRRGREIAEWLSRHQEHCNFVILDNDSDMLPEHEPRFVQTSFDTGLLDQHCARALAILHSEMGKHPID